MKRTILLLALTLLGCQGILKAQQVPPLQVEEALEPTYSRNIIKLQIINNQALFGVHSKSKSF